MLDLYQDDCVVTGKSGGGAKKKGKSHPREKKTENRRNQTKPTCYSSKHVRAQEAKAEMAAKRNSSGAKWRNGDPERMISDNSTFVDVNKFFLHDFINTVHKPVTEIPKLNISEYIRKVGIYNNRLMDINQRWFILCDINGRPYRDRNHRSRHWTMDYLDDNEETMITWWLWKTIDDNMVIRN